MSKILVVVAEKNFSEKLGRTLKRNGYITATANSGEESVRLAELFKPHLILMDIVLPGGMDGIEAARLIKDKFNIPIIFLTDSVNEDHIDRAKKVEPQGYIVKPVKIIEIKALIEIALYKFKRERFSAGKTNIDNILLFEKNSPMTKVMRMIDEVAPTDASILILGETGVGKGLVAEEIHRKSKRKDKPFTVLNISSLNAYLVESEMFGHEKGAFTGAVSRRIGKFELADKGTLFLDEIGELSLPLQVKLLRFFQEKKFQRVGGDKTIHTDVHLITATNKDLKKMVKEGEFREDLYYRISVFPIYIPPLRDRTQDIPVLANHFVDIYSQKYRKTAKHLTAEAISTLQNYNFPGNIRELENIIIRAVLLSKGEKIELEHLIFESSAGAKKDISDDILSLIQNRLEDALYKLKSGDESLLSSADQKKIMSFLIEKKNELVKFMALNVNNKITNSAYRGFFSCSAITARRHLKMLTSSRLLTQNQINHCGRGAFYYVEVTTKLR